MLLLCCVGADGIDEVSQQPIGCTLEIGPMGHDSKSRHYIKFEVDRERCTPDNSKRFGCTHLFGTNRRVDRAVWPAMYSREKLVRFALRGRLLHNRRCQSANRFSPHFSRIKWAAHQYTRKRTNFNGRVPAIDVVTRVS